MTTIEILSMPRHVAIIMDGNGRWAKSRFLERVRGHEKGAQAVREVTTACRKLGIEALSLYAFSEENWTRPKREVEALMLLLARYLDEEREEILTNHIRLVTSGLPEKLPESVRSRLLPLIEESKRNEGMFLNLCLSYTGRDEIVRACRRLAERVKAGELAPERIDEAAFGQALDVPDLPPVDLLIRTSGEMRLSGFLPWQGVYAELHFPTVLWPDFTKEHLFDAIRTYQQRERRFGKTSEQIKEPS